MSTLTLELRPREEQTAFNLRRWEEVVIDPDLRKFAGRVETDRHGRIIMSPPPAPNHGEFQIEIGMLLRKLMPHGKTISECAVSTADGVRGIDVAWASRELRREVGNRSCFIQAPEICVEILSPSNSDAEIKEKMALYFDAGALEVWICGVFGKMTFFGSDSKAMKRSKLCPKFPTQIEEQ
jgi:Uma2 family endonuclease